MRTCFLAIAICLLATVQSNAQTAAKSIFAELGGPGAASINFDTRFQKTNGGLGGRIGVGGFIFDETKSLTLPIAVNYLLSKDDRNFLEIGAGITYVRTSKMHYISDIDPAYYFEERRTFAESVGHISFGYRLQPAKGGFQFRVAVTPLFDSFGFNPYWASLSFGYKF